LDLSRNGASAALPLSFHNDGKQKSQVPDDADRGTAGVFA
jgi:hypothetical protein